MDVLQDCFEKVMAKLDEKDKNLRDTMKDLVTKEVGEVKTQIAEVQKKLINNSTRVKEVESKIGEAHTKIPELTAENKKLEILLEVKSV